MRAEAASVGLRHGSAKGHLDAAIRTAAVDRCGVDVVRQLSAVPGAAGQVRRDILEARLRGCLPQAVTEAGTDDLVGFIAATFATPPGSDPPADHARTTDPACGHRN